MNDKYDKFNNYVEDDVNFLIDDEKVILELIPKKIAFIFNKIFFMLPFILLWIFFDLFFMISVLKINFSFSFVFLIIIQLVPIYFYVFKVLSSSNKLANTKYYVTDKRIVIKNGFKGNTYRAFFYKDIANVNVRVGFINRLLGLGDIYFDVIGSISDGNDDTVLLDIQDYNDIFNKINSIISNNESEDR